MVQVVRNKVVSGVAIVMIDNPPVNALSHAVRKALWETIEAADAAPDITCIVIVAHGEMFSAGADITEFGNTPAHPSLPALISRIESCGKPVIAGLHGKALGGGFELALGAHYRLAHNDTRIGLPEIDLGLLPGAGGTQRLPRLTGPDVALKLMMSGKPISAEAAANRRMIDGRVDGDIASACLALARKLQSAKIPLRATRERDEGFNDVMGYFALLEESRDELDNPDLVAPPRLIDCIEAALLLPFDIGLAYERAAFEECLESDVSAALRHVFFAERNVAKQPDLAEVSPRSARSLAVIGGGRMGAGIALAALLSDMPVYLCDQNPEQLAHAMRVITSILEGQVTAGRIKPEIKTGLLARIRTGLDLDGAADADVVIETVTEDMAVKIDVMQGLGRVAKPGAILATNTSFLDIDTLAKATGRPADVIGLHFTSPAHVSKLVEVVPTASTAKPVTKTMFGLARKLGKTAVISAPVEGYLANRLLNAYRTACDHVLEDGASVEQIDAAMRRFGFATGPYQMADQSGLDVSWARRKRLAKTRDPLERYVRIEDVLCEQGRLGKKSGKGYYVYPDGTGAGQPDAAVAQIIATERTTREIEPRAFEDDSIRLRAILAMVNAGAELVRTRVAKCPADVDVVCLHGFGFPRWRGGPMQWSDSQGALAVKMALSKLAEEEDQRFWTPSPLFDKIIRDGGGFAALNG